MTFSSKFTALDNREAALLDDMRPEQRETFEQICVAYESEFRPKTEMERDTTYCLATLRWGIDRIRGLEESLRATFDDHSYMPPKFRPGLEELEGYHRELQTRYDYFFSHLLSLQGIRENRAA
jgi:hypothetical protein